MLRASDTPKRFVASCDKCSKHSVDFEAHTRDEAEKILKRDGWTDHARAGKGRDRWHWWCPTCAPKPFEGIPRSASAMPERNDDPVGEKGFVKSSDVEDPRLRTLLDDVRDEILKKN